MCLGKVANRLFGNRSKPPKQETPDPVGNESPATDQKETPDEKTQEKPDKSKDDTPSSSTSSESSVEDTGINY